MRRFLSVFAKICVIYVCMWFSENCSQSCNCWKLHGSFTKLKHSRTRTFNKLKIIHNIKFSTLCNETFVTTNVFVGLLWYERKPKGEGVTVEVQDVPLFTNLVKNE